MKTLKSVVILGALLSFAALGAETNSLLSYSRTIPVVQAALSSGVISAMTVDFYGNTYLTGSTKNAAFPTTPGVVQPAFGGSEDAFVIKLDRTGAVVFATYLGGSGFDRATSIAVDSSGYVLVGGVTVSVASFPTTTPTPFPGSGTGTAFIAKLHSDGSRFIYSFIIPGANGKTAVAADQNGNAYFASTGGAAFPVTTGAVQGHGSIVVGKLNILGDTLLFGARFGGSSANETAADIAFDGSYNTYVTGTTSSADFPVTAGAFQTSLHGTSAAFAAKLNATGTALVYATYLGGSASESSSQIRVDAYGDAFVLGASQSTDFPVTPGAYQPTNTDVNNTAFLAKLNPTGTGIGYATYVSGVVGLSPSADPTLSVGAFDIDGSGNAYIASRISGGLQTTTGAYQPTPGGGTDCGLVMLNSTGALESASYFGGSGNETPTAIAVAPDGLLAFAGTTNSPNFPITTGSTPTNLTGFVSRVRISSVIPQVPPTYFEVGDGQGSSIVVRFTRREGIRNAWEIMRGRMTGMMEGKIVRSDVSYGPQWHFHVDTTTVTVEDKAAREICDAVLPIIAEEGDDLGGHFLPHLAWCPWGTQILAQLATPADQADHIIHVSAADFTEVAMAPGSLVTAFGTALAASPVAAPPDQAPPSLGGVSISLKDSAGVSWAAPLLYVSPTQVNYQLPEGIAVGRVTATLTTSDQRSIAEQIYVQPVSPSLFTVGTSGYASGYITRITADGTVSYEPIVQIDQATGAASLVPIDLGPDSDQVYLSLFGTGIRSRPALESLYGAFLGFGLGANLNPTYAGPQPTSPGVDQINGLLSRDLVGAGTVSLRIESVWPYSTNRNVERFTQLSEYVKLAFK